MRSERDFSGFGVGTPAAGVATGGTSSLPRTPVQGIAGRSDDRSTSRSQNVDVCPGLPRVAAHDAASPTVFYTYVTTSGFANLLPVRIHAVSCYGGFRGILASLPLLKSCTSGCPCLFPVRRPSRKCALVYAVSQAAVIMAFIYGVASV